nr:PREDICTED: hemicentin-2-like isoform X1 [Lepisosteus oculatus]XP_015193256.1 PREDICTED: hemicentin-2-like isoform X1 [Lepisosteus oculatus]XP_015193257.1 PREDICTED: hemicentin-2-like isoform X1 [Lepisosteus oculatus]XP_015193258.1 PREDICTED: hemicentin-2-like isoform X1 [Lepisosteus oculatus]
MVSARMVSLSWLVFAAVGGVARALESATRDTRAHGLLGESVLLAVSYNITPGSSIKWVVEKANSSRDRLVEGSLVTPDVYSNRVERLWENGSLSLTNLSLADSGIYTMIVTDVRGNQNKRVINLTISAPVRVSSFSVSPHPPLVGCPVNLTCVLSGGVSPQVFWQKNQTPDFNSSQAVLSIPALEPSACGWYTCWAWDNYSSHQDSYRLTVPSCENDFISVVIPIIVIAFLLVVLGFLIKKCCHLKHHSKISECKRRTDPTPMQAPSPLSDTVTDVHYAELSFQARGRKPPASSLRTPADSCVIYSEARV